MSVTEPTPERILEITGAAQATALLGAAVDAGVFARLEAGAQTPDDLAKALSVSPRGARALLDGLVALRLVTLAAGKYANTPDASAFLVEGKPGSLTGLARLAHQGMADWLKLPQAVKTGAPVTALPGDAKDNPAWIPFVSALAPLTARVAQIVVTTLKVENGGPASVLDVGGGAGAFSAAVLRANRQAQATQIDWPTVNAVARAAIDKLGVGDRFHTVDGDLRTVDYGSDRDIAFYSNVARLYSPAQNLGVFRRIRQALTSHGVLVVSDAMTRDDRSGPPGDLLVQSQMLLSSKEGGVWRIEDYRRWLAEAGFLRVVFAETGGPSTLVYASAAA